MKESQPPYKGSENRLIVAFDVGTTYSGISYTVLEPGLVPEIIGVTRFPSQGNAGNAKIPSEIYYDRHGQVRAVGAEVKDEEKIEKAQQQNWTLCKLFKLHVKLPPNPPSIADCNKYVLGELPPTKTVVDVFADFLQYLFSCATTFIQESTPGGLAFWASIEDDIEFVLTHPNGWEGAEQASIRQAAIQAGLVPDTLVGHARIHFVTEGEASLHFCVLNGLNMPQKGVIIVDAGGGTVDLSVYCKNTDATRYQEVAIPKSVFAGSAFVTGEAEKYFAKRFSSTRFKGDVSRMTSIFDSKAKLVFKEDTEASFVTFGRYDDHDEQHGIRAGQLKIARDQVANFFSYSIKSIAEAVVEQQIGLKEKVVDIFLVGGFASSSWLFTQLKVILEPLGFTVLRPDRYINKAVADGAISFYLNHLVTSRISRRIYGAECIRDFNPDDPEHQKRALDIKFSCCAKSELHGGFDVILGKDVRVLESQEFRRPFFLERKTVEELKTVTADVLVYEGRDPNPQWLDADPDNFLHLCRITADTTAACKGLRPRRMNGRKYYRLDYQVVLCLGLTELKAQVCWIERGVEKRSPARIVYTSVDRV
ncbi:hypothetical protein K435DRAFT_169479 [Dendrothele bispora CBS 962.96]|uniref:Actin-like ATPase domain-containing protein n=1 Tax=Dendrothele bispora (strain CBS 962.96) TaxID=1314807 RepID=A0A4S8MWR8_DENBC|nr:hypothetical protein K435DRAFT_169479 [Dendrothele bispora CBS 962.96]